MLILERLLIFVLLVWGVTTIVSKSQIAAPLRDRLELLHPKLGQLSRCYMCAGWWMALLVSALGLGVCNQLRQSGGWWLAVDSVLDAFLGSGTTWLLHVIAARLGSEEL